MAKREFVYDARPGLGRAGDVPVPSAEILDYARENDILKFKGLAVHILTTVVVSDVLIREVQRANATKPIEEQFEVNPDLVFESLIATHATRSIADQAKAGEASPALNRYIQEHDDVEFAAMMGTAEGLPLSVLQLIENLEMRRGFPVNTLGPDSPYHPATIDWNGAINQIASWSVNQTIQPIDRRFDMLIASYANNPNTTRGLLTAEKLISYKEWGKERIADLCRHIGVEPENYLAFLKDKLFDSLLMLNAQEKSDELKRELFPNRENRDDEFLPVSPVYSFLAKSIMAIDDPKQKRRVERMLENPESYIKSLRKFGLIS